MHSQLTVKFIKTLWGVTEEMGNCPSGYSRLFARIKAEGFSGVETPVSLVADKPAFLRALAENDLVYVAMINTCTFAPDRASSRLEDHLASFDRLIAEAQEMNPILINSHSGRDSWDMDTAIAFFTHALSIEAKTGLTILHETHRGRVLYNPWTTRDLCKKFPALKLTADLSHFCVVAERVFDSKSGLDDDWEEVLSLVAERTGHIHARVGYAQGPQVPDPSAPEFKSALEAHESWWDRILATQAHLGKTMMTVEPEHGTDGYQQRLPHTGVETADIWVVNNWVKDRQRARMALQAYWKHTA
jgi:hypothetical protein